LLLVLMPLFTLLPALGAAPVGIPPPLSSCWRLPWASAKPDTHMASATATAKLTILVVIINSICLEGHERNDWAWCQFLAQVILLTILLPVCANRGSGTSQVKTSYRAVPAPPATSGSHSPFFKMAQPKVHWAAVQKRALGKDSQRRRPLLPVTSPDPRSRELRTQPQFPALRFAKTLSFGIVECTTAVFRLPKPAIRGNRRRWARPFVVPILLLLRTSGFSARHGINHGAVVARGFIEGVNPTAPFRD
jgi:hypothetical protein